VVDEMKLLTLTLALLLGTVSRGQEVKGNKMGMTMDEFKALHAEQFKNGFHLVARCYKNHFLTSIDSPDVQMCQMPGGGLKLAEVKVHVWKAYFYKGSLYRILYEVDPKGYDDIHDVLIKMYGQPLAHSEEESYAVPDDLSETPSHDFHFGAGWKAEDMLVNIWYAQSTPIKYETTTYRNCTVEFVLANVQSEVDKAGKNHKKPDSL
jgi:hypothetical protein